jgi:hypothetical protein
LNAVATPMSTGPICRRLMIGLGLIEPELSALIPMASCAMLILFDCYDSRCLISL